MSETVKARKHYGADSLDITIPAELVRELEISEGDIFKISINEENENLEITYERVYGSD